MADFDICFPFLLGNEDWTPPRYEAISDPTQSDPSALALSGINSHYWPEDFAAIVALPKSARPEAVKAFYERRYWSKWLAAIDSNRVAAMILDSSVNQGAGVAARCAQIAAGLPESEQDGMWGPRTVAAVNGAAPAVLAPAFVEARCAAYRRVGSPSLPEWLARAQKIPNFE